MITAAAAGEESASMVEKFILITLMLFNIGENRSEELRREVLRRMYIVVQYIEGRWERASAMQIEWFTVAPHPKQPNQYGAVPLGYASKGLSPQLIGLRIEKHISFHENRGLICRWGVLFHVTE